MNEVIIRIIDTDNNVEGDLDLTNFNDFPLAINKGIVNLDNLKERTGTFTKMFKVPSSKNNTDLLSNVDNINSRKDFRDCLNKKPCIILVNNNPVEYGFVQVVKAFNDIEGGYFELVFYGNNIDWVKDATDLKLNTINWTDNQLFFIQAGIDSVNSLTSSSTDMALPYISRGGNPITDATSVTDYLPCIYVKNLIEKCFLALGYNVESNFLTDIRQLVCDLALIPEQSESDIENSKVRAEQTTTIQIADGSVRRLLFDDETTPPNKDNDNNYIPAQGIYVTPTTGVYSLNVTISDFNIDDRANLHIVRNGISVSYIGTGTILRTEILAPVRLDTTPGAVFVDLSLNFNISLKQNEQLSIYIEPTLGNFLPISIRDQTFFDIQLTSEISAGDSYTVSKLIPDSVKFIDILNDFTRMFNIYYWTDVKTKTVYFEPRDNFFQSKTTAIDWSDKLDTSKGYSVDYVSSYKRNINFSYKNDTNDKYLEKWNLFNKKTYGKYTHELPNRFAKGNTEIGLDFFSATYGHKALEVSDSTGFSTLKIWNEYKSNGDTPEEPNRGYQPRIFFHKNGTQTSLDGYSRSIRVNDEISSTLRSVIPYGSFEVYYNAKITPASFNLNFADGLDADETTVDIGLFNRFYSKMFKNIEEGGRIVAYFDLNSNDIQNLDFRQLIYLEGDSNVKGYYLIEKVVDYNPLTSEPTKVSLFKFENLGSVSIDGNQTGNNDSNTDDGLTPPTLQPIYVENGALLIEVYIENPITGLIEPVFK